ncbi:MAG: DUF4956 domain-containing protein [Clostridiales bacterium]|nr:DUF4956 domain-containing protein [Clostridiales bacterium]
MNYMAQQKTIEPVQLIFNMTVALVLGMVIFITYRLTYSGAAYSKKFNASLMMMTLVTTVVMTVISNNIALSLGMVGALSIIRFRTAIKDPRDTTFIFWCIAVGICCGISFYTVAAIGSLYIFAVMLILGRVHTVEKRLLLIRAERAVEKNIESVVYLYFKKIELQAKNTTGDEVEYIYVLSNRTLLQAQKNNEESITDKLYAIEGVQMVNVIAQNDDMSY